MQWGRAKPYLLWIGSILLVTLLACSLVDDFLLRLHIAFAEDQTAVFEQMRQQVRASDAAEAEAICLEYVVYYYPSGTKQDTGTPLDRVVERAQLATVREIIAILRSKTAQDLGEHPHRWIEALRRPRP